MGFTQMARMRGLVASSRILSLEYRDATFDESEALRVAPGARCWIFRGCASTIGRPLLKCCECAMQRAALAGRFHFTGSIYAALEADCDACGCLSIVDATVAEASLLGSGDRPRPVATPSRLASAAVASTTST